MAALAQSARRGAGAVMTGPAKLAQRRLPYRIPIGSLHTSRSRLFHSFYHFLGLLRVFAKYANLPVLDPVRVRSRSAVSVA